jgi:next-to-BRCA1 protein 1
MAATTHVPVTLDTPIVVKILFRGQTKKFKLPLKDLGAHVLPEKVRIIPHYPYDVTYEPANCDLESR